MTGLSIVIVFSGILQIAWVIMTSGQFSFYYLSVYFVILGAVIYFSAYRTSLFGWSLLNAGGLPPLSGFIIKYKAILNIKSAISFCLVGFSGLALVSYVRLLVNARFSRSSPSVLFFFSSTLGLV